MTVVSVSQDPANAGGIGTVTRWYRTWMDVHRPDTRRDYYLDDTTRSGFLRQARGWTPSNEAVPRLLPRLHFPQYYAGRGILRQVVADADEAHVIGGSVLHGALAARLPSVLWIGTTIRDERLAVLRYHDPLRRLLYSVTLPTLERIESQVFSAASRVLAQSSHTANLVAAAGIPIERIEVVPVPVDTEVFKPCQESERQGLLFVGRALDPRKGFDRVARLLDASLAAANAGLDIVSPGEPPEALCSRIATGQVRWRSRVEDVSERFRSAQVFLLASHQEGFGIAAFEALASGTPVVAMRSGGADELLLRSGGAVVADSEAAFTAAVDTLLKDKSRREDMGATARAWAEANLAASGFLADSQIFCV